MQKSHVSGIRGLLLYMLVFIKVHLNTLSAVIAGIVVTLLIITLNADCKCIIVIRGAP